MLPRTTKKKNFFYTKLELALTNLVAAALASRLYARCGIDEGRDPQDLALLDLELLVRHHPDLRSFCKLGAGVDVLERGAPCEGSGDGDDGLADAVLVGNAQDGGKPGDSVVLAVGVLGLVFQPRVLVGLRRVHLENKLIGEHLAQNVAFFLEGLDELVSPCVVVLGAVNVLEVHRVVEGCVGAALGLARQLEAVVHNDLALLPACQIDVGVLLSEVLGPDEGNLRVVGEQSVLASIDYP